MSTSSGPLVTHAGMGIPVSQVGIINRFQMHLEQLDVLRRPT